MPRTALSRHIARQALEIFNRYLFAGIAMGHFVNIGLQLNNALRPYAAASGVYVLGLIWYLAHAANPVLAHAVRSARRSLSRTQTS